VQISELIETVFDWLCSFLDENDDEEFKAEVVAVFTSTVSVSTAKVDNRCGEFTITHRVLRVFDSMFRVLEAGDAMEPTRIGRLTLSVLKIWRPGRWVFP